MMQVGCMKKQIAALALWGLSFAAVADGDAWRRINYPDYVRNWPQMKGVMLGASGEPTTNPLSRCRRDSI